MKGHRLLSGSRRASDAHPLLAFLNLEFGNA